MWKRQESNLSPPRLQLMLQIPNKQQQYNSGSQYINPLKYFTEFELVVPGTLPTELLFQFGCKS